MRYGVRYGVRDFYEDKSPQRLFVIDVYTADPYCRIELVGPARPSRARRRRLLQAMRAALLALQRLERPDWTGWHDGHSWLGHPAHLLGVRAAALYTSHAGPYEPLGVTFLEGALVPQVRLWGTPSAEGAALAMARALLSPERMRRLELAYEQKLAREAER